MASSLGTVIYSSRVTAVYDPRAFILHAALLRHAFAHCGRFSTAASRRSLGSISVPVWVTILSDHLPVIALVEPLPHQQANRTRAHPEAEPFSCSNRSRWATSGINPRFHGLSRTSGQIAHALLTLSPLSNNRDHYSVRLACLIHAASVHSEPGSNSPLQKIITLTSVSV